MCSSFLYLSFSLFEAHCQDNSLNKSAFIEYQKIKNSFPISEDSALQILKTNIYLNLLINKSLEICPVKKTELLFLNYPESAQPDFEIMLCETEIISDNKYVVPIATFNLNAFSGKAYAIARNRLAGTVPLRKWKP